MIPAYFLTSDPKVNEWMELTAEEMESRGCKIEWSFGPKVNGVDISYMFMYPPTIGIDKFNAELRVEIDLNRAQMRAKIKENSDYPVIAEVDFHEN